MEVKLQIDPAARGVTVTVTAPAATPEVEELVRRLEREGAPRWIAAFRDGEAVQLPLGDVLCFFTDGKGVSCRTAQGTYAVRQRLYELEEELAGTRFVRVSSSEIVDLDQVTALDLSLSGTIKMTLRDGAAVCWASRRYVKKIKQAIGL